MNASPPRRPDAKILRGNEGLPASFVSSCLRGDSLRANFGHGLHHSRIVAPQTSRFSHAVFVYDTAPMRALLVALFLTPAALLAADDLFTGVPPEKIPPDAQQLLDGLKRAFDTGEPN